MENKKIYYIIGGIAVLGIGYYLWNKSKASSYEEKETVNEKVVATKKQENISKGELKSQLNKIPLKIPSSAVSTTPEIKKLTPQELEIELAVCGKKPRLKKNKKKYEQCRSNIMDKLKGEGLVAFDGSYVMDESVSSAGFLPDFDNTLNLDL